MRLGPRCAAFPRQMEVAFTERIGPLVVEGAGHFVQWEQAEKLNQAVRYLCLDLVEQRRQSDLF